MLKGVAKSILTKAKTTSFDFWKSFFYLGIEPDYLGVVLLISRDQILARNIVILIVHFGERP